MRRGGLWVMVALAGAGVCWGQGATPRPALVVLNKDANELAIVDVGTLKVVGRVSTGPVPHEVAVSDDGKIAVATNYGAEQKGTTLSVIDLDAQKEIHRVSLLGVTGPHGEKFADLIGPHGVQFFAGEFYFTAEGSKSIAAYNPATNAITMKIPIGQNRTHMLVYAQDGKTIYTSNVNSDTVSALLPGTAGSVQVTNIAVGKGPEGIDLSPDGKEVWAANSGDGSVSIIDAQTKKVIETIAVGTKHSNRVKFTPDGKWVLLSDMGSGELLVVHAKTRKVTKRMKLGSSVEGILVQPDGARAFVAVSGDNKVDVVDLGTWAVVGTVETGKDPDGLGWRQ